MDATLTALITSHLLGSLIVQYAWAPNWRRRPWPAFYSALTVTAVSCLLLGGFCLAIQPVIFLAHAVVNMLAMYHPSLSLRRLCLEQSAHFALLMLLAVSQPGAAQAGWWMTSLPPLWQAWYFAALTFVSGVILCVPGGGILIARLTRRFAEEMYSSEIAGLTGGGKYIGWLERSLVLLLMLIGQPGGIGFLIAAKSILRFGEIKDPAQRKVAEYIIIGTFLSFGWALGIAVIIQKALKYWLR